MVLELQQPTHNPALLLGTPEQELSFVRIYTQLERSISGAHYKGLADPTAHISPLSSGRRCPGGFAQLLECQHSHRRAAGSQEPGDSRERRNSSTRASDSRDTPTTTQQPSEQPEQPEQLEQLDEPGDSDNEGSDSNTDSDDNDDGVVRCVCGERNDGELMIQCEVCQVWQHTLCMGIRDEAHIPDQYYCEKCRPEDHPYVNSRPRTLVLAEASALGTMMRRSAALAVAKMTAREEYRSAAAAAAIAASVAAATARSRKASKKQGGKRPDATRKKAKPKEDEPESSDAVSDPLHDDALTSPAKQGTAARRTQTPKRPASKRRKTDDLPAADENDCSDGLDAITVMDDRPRNRSVSTVVKPDDLGAGLADKRRGKSAPGSPQLSCSPSPTLQSLLYGDKTERPVKRRRTGGSVRGKTRMTVSAANSPHLDTGLFSESTEPPAETEPLPQFAPLEMVDIDGNSITIPPHLLNAQGQPMFSSASEETMCRIRYPHQRASVTELGRRAKQLLEWLGKMQSEWELEAPVSPQVSEAPTSPINPADWPDDHDARPPRSTGAIMEDLVWRLIRFQETYP
ncbi:Histone deacetylase complex subunit [Coemansia spiralis]|uniref:Histone deacetylase complex subunit n=2 Tax=Coemansia TaxID=4863 RepID=A0A9W8FXJ4_9FUNG|nr:Histone deacetylase complex subunit [Coemansia umbellata]KAJ2620352.1 Histone deacetylase complex subunit [Coemansia sp. RSA 1358]KAJ2669654.1 Histone deacetylase complex subunit [Coemansia spiralis]